MMMVLTMMRMMMIMTMMRMRIRIRMTMMMMMVMMTITMMTMMLTMLELSRRWCEGGGWLTGVVEPGTGSFTGDNIAFLSPDLNTALLGSFRDGVAERVSPARLLSVRTEGVRS